MGGGFAETSVVFTRQGLSETRGGGFRGDPTETYLTSYCHVEVEDRNDPNSQTLGLGMVQTRCWRIFLPVQQPHDTVLPTSKYPKKGDRVTFTTDYGVTISLPIRYVQSPDSIIDHFECETEEYQ